MKIVVTKDDATKAIYKLHNIEYHTTLAGGIFPQNELDSVEFDFEVPREKEIEVPREKEIEIKEDILARELLVDLISAVKKVEETCKIDFRKVFFKPKDNDMNELYKELYYD